MNDINYCINEKSPLTPFTKGGKNSGEQGSPPFLKGDLGHKRLNKAITEACSRQVSNEV